MGGPAAPAGGASLVGRARSFARLVFRKAVYRRHYLGRWDVRAGDMADPDIDDGLEIELLGPDRFAEVLGTSPHLTEEDLAILRRQRSTVIVTRDEGRIVASTWMTSGDVLNDELHRHLDVPSFEHLSCRSYVSDGYRGRNLMGRMIAAYARTLDPDDEVWGLVYPWNEASIRTLEGIGWRRTGAEWTHFVADQKVPGSRRHPPQPVLPRATRAPDGSRRPLPPCILVGGESWGSTLQAARSLGRIGVPVLVVTLGDGSAVYERSRFVARAVDLHRPRPEDLASTLADLAADAVALGSTVPVLPLTDQAVDLLDRGRHLLPDGVRLALPSSPAVRPLLDKPSAMAIAVDAGLDVLPWVEVTSFEDGPAAAALELPVIIRPSGWDKTGDLYFKLVVARTDAERDGALHAMLERGARMVVQEYLEAPEDAVELAITWRSADGTTTAVCTGRKRRAASGQGGVMAWGEAVDLPDVAESAAAFLDASGFVGLGGLEVIRSRGRAWFVEFNPRLESIHFLAAAAGVDTVVLAYQDLALDQRPVAPLRTGPVAAWIGAAWLDRIRTDPDGWRLALEERRRFQRFRHRRRAIWDASDPLPSVAVIGRMGRQAIARRTDGRGAP